MRRQPHVSGQGPILLLRLRHFARAGRRALFATNYMSSAGYELLPVASNFSHRVADNQCGDRMSSVNKFGPSPKTL
jgi:hypothetical protein